MITSLLTDTQADRQRILSAAGTTVGTMNNNNNNRPYEPHREKYLNNYHKGKTEKKKQNLMCVCAVLVSQIKTLFL